MGILDEDIARVRDATDIVALIGEHVPLKRVGRRHMGRCPFHEERTPSFSVNPDLGVWHCFGCGKSGDAITFVREMEHLDFVEAVERLANRAGVTLRYDDANQSKDRRRRSRLHEAVASAIDFYHRRLLDGDDAGGARRYLRSRGFDGDAARRFALGWAPESFDALARHLHDQKFARQDLVDAGLVFVNRAQRVQDQFRSRLLFPIHDHRGEPVGFGGRALVDGQGPKYKNSPESVIYRKSHVLFWLHEAKAEVVARGDVVVCEGYTDVMAFVLAGVPNAVATCGTSLTEEHFTLLKNLSPRITLAYDADSAGQAAAERCYQWEQRSEVQFRIADLPPGLDPADAWRADAGSLARAVDGSAPFLEFRLRRLLAASDLATIEGRGRAGDAAVRLVAEHPSDLVRDQYAMQIAGELHIEVERLREAIASARRGRGVTLAVAAPEWGRPVDLSSVDRRELDALRWVVHAPEQIAGRLDGTLFADALMHETFEVLARAQTFHEALEQADPAVAHVLERLAVEDIGESDAELVDRVVVNLVEAATRRMLESLVADDDERSLDVKRLLDELVIARDLGHWPTAQEASDQLVTWISGSDGWSADR
jgi:DNA primase